MVVNSWSARSEPGLPVERYSGDSKPLGLLPAPRSSWALAVWWLLPSNPACIHALLRSRCCRRVGRVLATTLIARSLVPTGSREGLLSGPVGWRSFTPLELKSCLAGRRGASGIRYVLACTDSRLHCHLTPLGGVIACKCCTAFVVRVVRSWLSPRSRSR